jgi:hypothetical protein
MLVVAPLMSLLAALVFDEAIQIRRKLGLLIFAAALGLSLRSTHIIYNRYHPVLKDVKAAGAYLGGRNANTPVYVDPLLLDIPLRLFSADRLSDIRILGGNPVMENDSLVIIGGTRGLKKIPRDVTDFYAENHPLLLDTATGGASPGFATLQTFEPVDPSSGYLPLRICRVMADEVYSPPILEIAIVETAGERVLLNGYVEADGEGNRAKMSVCVDGKNIHDDFYFPLWLELPATGKHEIRVKARDLRGLVTEKHLQVEIDEGSGQSF